MAVQRAIQWNFNFHELRRWAVEHGSIDVPFKWKDPTGDFSNEFAKWFHAQPTLFLQRRLSLDQVSLRTLPFRIADSSILRVAVFP